ncbi:MAG: hypothetical protein ABMA00_12225 [Gemmatimonas sp.]
MNRFGIDVGRRFERAVRPVLRVTRKGEPDFIGSGVLLRVGHVHFLLSAAHVFDEPSEVAIPAGVHGGVVVTFGSVGHVELSGRLHMTAMPKSGNRVDDRVDEIVGTWTTSSSIPLVGILTEHRPRKAKALIATRVQAHLALILNARPELLEHLPQPASATDIGPIYSGPIPPVAR